MVEKSDSFYQIIRLLHLFWHVNDDNNMGYVFAISYMRSLDSRKQADSVNYELSNINADFNRYSGTDGQQTDLTIFFYLKSVYTAETRKKKEQGGIVTNY